MNFSLIACLTALLPAGAFAGDAVETVATGRLSIAGGHGGAQLALYSEAVFNDPQPGMIRAIVVFHGLHRNAAAYLRDVQSARTKAGAAGEITLLISPRAVA